ncbi:hypothetical protein GGR57DRAFT_87770 [Xylariaceae sp. FL1272]|nr:hypothetical protein GGR57DRAFT_87770 [Xylariaceae sp. FL1272]
MTKPWDVHEETIKSLYAEHTLSDVRRIMMERYNFKASTRAYRGRLIKWGVRKYNRRRPNEFDAMSASPGASTSRGDTASPPIPYQTRDTVNDNSRGHSYGHHSTSNSSGHLYSATDAAACSTSRNSMLASSTPSSVPSTSYSHSDYSTGQGEYYRYQPLSPAYPPSPYESDQAVYYRSQSYPDTTTQHHSTSQMNLPYPDAQNYGQGHTSAMGYDNHRHNNAKR